MEKEHFEVLLERIEDHVKLSIEGHEQLDRNIEGLREEVRGNTRCLDRIDIRLSSTEHRMREVGDRLDRVGDRLDGVEKGLANVVGDVREIKRSMGVQTNP